MLATHHLDGCGLGEKGSFSQFRCGQNSAPTSDSVAVAIWAFGWRNGIMPSIFKGLSKLGVVVRGVDKL